MPRFLQGGVAKGWRMWCAAGRRTRHAPWCHVRTVNKRSIQAERGHAPPEPWQAHAGRVQAQPRQGAGTAQAVFAAA